MTRNLYVVALSVVAFCLGYLVAAEGDSKSLWLKLLALSLAFCMCWCVVKLTEEAP